MNVTVEQLAALQSKQDRIRNMCILAHVDHGKTTLSDSLIAANGLIHPKMVGELRYLDSRDDEQARGITMKSSSIALLYVPGATQRPEGARSVTDEEKMSQGLLINLIDSPGHVDFCSEVSTAARLSDGGLVVVDAVEGVCIQTHAVLRQAWEEKVKPCLFINKIDRLVLELRLTPAEAYQRIKQIVTHVNMIVSAFQSERFINEADAVLAHEGRAAEEQERQDGSEAGCDSESAISASDAAASAAAAAADEDEEDIFQPALGNVAFGSAYDGWAFCLDQFGTMYAEKLGCRAEALTRALWGDWHFSAKDKRVIATNKRKGGAQPLKPMFVQFALEPIWKAYSVCDAGEDVAGVLGAIVRGRSLKQVPAKALEHPEPRQAMRAVLRAWLPLSEAVLGMAAAHMPSPTAAAPARLPHLLAARPGQLTGLDLPPEATAELANVEAGMMASSAADNAPTVVYVSKMISVPASLVPRIPGEPAPAATQNGEVFLAFGRVFSGVVRDGQLLHVLSPAYSPSVPALHRQEATVQGLFMMMGRALERLTEVPAGNVLALGGLDVAILKSATLCSTPCCRPLAPMLFQAAPIVKVAVEPARPSDMPALVEGLRLLNRADPFVEVEVMESGEHVLGAAGEVHLETCLKDLRERFARIELQVSAPLVAFRETVHTPAEAPEAASAAPPRMPRIVEVTTPNGAATLRVRALPLPGAIASSLDEHGGDLRRALVTQRRRSRRLDGAAYVATHAAATAVEHGAEGDSSHSRSHTSGDDGLHNLHVAGSEHESDDAGELAPWQVKLREQASALEGGKLLVLLQRAWQLGPKQVGPNVLLAQAPRAAAPATGTSLFDVPPSNVVRVSSRQQSSHHTARLVAVVEDPSLQQQQQQQLSASAGETVPRTRPAQLLLGRPEAARLLGLAPASSCGSSHPTELPPGLEHVQDSIESGVGAGFQMAAACGPLCEEPMWGVAFEVDVRVNLPLAEASGAAAGAPSGQGPSQEVGLDLQEDVYGPFFGQVMTAFAGACRRAVLEAEPRLVEAQYLCQVQAAAEALSGVYAVLNRRRARVLREELKEGSGMFSIHAYVPVAECFGLADDMRRRSSGGGSASLMLSHWERLQVDPFFVPTTEEELEEFGVEGAANQVATNLARRLIDAVRRRKGLPVQEKVVKDATKQRTLKRNV